MFRTWTPNFAGFLWNFWKFTATLDQSLKSADFGLRIWFEDMDMEMETLDMKRANNSVKSREKSATFSAKMPDYFFKNFREY